MTWTKPDTSYWNEKFAAWWHDPIDKVLAIPGHEERAADYLQIFGMDRPNDAFWRKADGIAAGFERGQVPTFSTDPGKNGAVDYRHSPRLTHPTSQNGLLTIQGTLPEVNDVFPGVQDFLKKTIGTKAGKGDYAAKFAQDEHRFAQARFLYTHLVLRFALAENNVGGLGALWHRLPADSRFPDHTIWQHNALCSALYSSMELSKSRAEVGLMSFAITPVQAFIARARKLRDFWTGSVLLSWMTFAAIRWIMENLGADHILYPSLIDQPLVNSWLETEWHVSGKFRPRIWEKTPRDIASLPNKLLVLIPGAQAKDIADELERAVREAWGELAEMTADDIINKMSLVDEKAAHLRFIFKRQNEKFWQCHWAAARLAGMDDEAEINALLHESSFKNQRNFLYNFDGIFKAKDYSLRDASYGIFYSTTHSLVQSALAAEKMRRVNERADEPGEKCQMCGEFEVLHALPWGEGTSAIEYAGHLKDFWTGFKEEQRSDVDVKENERLCSVCSVKRFLPQIVKKKNNHPLSDVLGSSAGFPSTTEMALAGYFDRKSINDQKLRKEIATQLFNNEEFVKGQDITNSDKYYAILIMDGDNMGKLINGQTIAATWEGIMHPDIVARLTGAGFDKLYREPWEKVFKSGGTGSALHKRLVTPAIHAAISEALGDFSLYGVPEIIARHGGRLVYAGGDDVCAFLPLQSALSAAREIKDYYTSVYRFIDVDRKSKPLETEWVPTAGKLSVNLGSGEGISISAAILICHHKESLAQMIDHAHKLLSSEAKRRAGRNACTVELRKRNGGERIFTRKWDDTDDWEAFWGLIESAGGKLREVSHSLLYRLESMRPGIEAILASGEGAKERLIRFLSAQVERSGQKTGKAVTERNDGRNVNDEGNEQNKRNSPDGRSVRKQDIAAMIAQIVWDRNDAKKPFKTDGLIIAAFLGGGEEDGMV